VVEKANIQSWAEGWSALNRERSLTDDEIRHRAREIVAGLNLKQKVQQLHGSLKWLKIMSLGWKYGSEPYKMTDSPDTDIPPLYFTDGPRGATMQGSTCFPVSMARGATFDPDLEARIGDAIGVEGRSHGSSYYAGVCINLLRHPGWGRAQETYGEDPYHLGEMGAALTRGAQRHMMACVKHYAVNSVDNTRFKVDIKISERTLREVYLPHFKRCVVDEQAASVMGAYNKLNGEQCCHHNHLLRDILKSEWGFDGFVSSDWVYGVKDTVAGITGGLDVEMPWGKFYKKLTKLVQQGKLQESLIDEAVERVVRKKLQFSYVGESQRYSPSAIGCEQHRAVALEAAEKSLVLLQNQAPTPEASPLLPLNPAKPQKMAVLGRLATAENLGDKGSSRVRPDYVITPLQGLEDACQLGIDLVYEPGKKIERAVEAAKDADVAVLVVGYTDKEEGEYMIIKGGDRKTLTLPAHDEAMIEAVAAVNPNTVVVMIGGSAIITERWRNKVAAILMAWYPGMEGGRAIANVLFGRVNPSGKLPCVFPKTESQLPPFDVGALEMEYGYYHGYRLLDRDQSEPAFPFGFGLSYSRFAYSNLRLAVAIVSEPNTLQVFVDITNTGKRAGEEVAQLYIGYGRSAVGRFVKELKGFQRVSLAAGETRTLSFSVPVSALAYYCEDNAEWVVEEGGYQVYVGPSSDTSQALAEGFRVVSSPAVKAVAAV